MSQSRPRRPFNPSYIARRFGLTALLAVTAGVGIASRVNADNSAAVVAPAPNQTATVQPTAEATAALYGDGEYKGDAYSAGRWGSVATTVTIKDGKIVDLSVVNYPHSTALSTRISQSVLPRLMQEVVDKQSANVDVISGATMTVDAFAQSVQSALDSARLNL